MTLPDDSSANKSACYGVRLDAKLLRSELMKAAMTWLALQNRGSRRVWALVCLVLFVTLQVFAASDILHKSVHADCATAGHHCVITLLADGQVNWVGSSAGLIALVALLLFSLPLLNAQAVSSADFLLAPSRAPPRR
jgi:hypothetical protein